MSLKPINSRDELITYLHAALQLEHATIPPYLMALYSIHPGTNSDAVHIFRAVLIEEMLHLTLAANLLNAVGGTPDLASPGFVPSYPTYLPNGETDFLVSRQRFCPEALKTFLDIERPAKAPSEESRTTRRKHVVGRLRACMAGDSPDLSFYTIGEFYQEICRGLTFLQAEKVRGGETLFVGDRARQVTPAYYYSGGGDVLPVVDLPSALEAMRLIMEQGEGFEHGIYDREGEISHYYRFQQLTLGQYYRKGDEAGKPSGGPLAVDWNAVYPTLTDARLTDFPLDSEVRKAAREFNGFYHQFLGRLTTAYSGHPEGLMAAVGDMFRIKEYAIALIRNPIPGGAGKHAGPTFEIDEYIAATAGEKK